MVRMVVCSHLAMPHSLAQLPVQRDLWWGPLSLHRINEATGSPRPRQGCAGLLKDLETLVAACLTTRSGPRHSLSLLTPLKSVAAFSPLELHALRESA